MTGPKMVPIWFALMVINLLGVAAATELGLLKAVVFTGAGTSAWLFMSGIVDLLRPTTAVENTVPTKPE
ncbi:hypothetical protein [Pseudomonas amygdali]|uniref:hypothetical protein n=1 Tax=Pseudomonas amygdali TaxID=47877 RepID=UPI000C328F14|nr:hypothetical protein [Pseudomonas amygdali]PWD01899.1 hypothetical protein CX658_18205 [Pseudomonas amygdali pv. lachrymans]